VAHGTLAFFCGWPGLQIGLTVIITAKAPALTPILRLLATIGQKNVGRVKLFSVSHNR
jgi:hypothetical protein